MLRFPALKPWTLYNFPCIWLVISYVNSASPIHLKSVKSIVTGWHEFYKRYLTEIKYEVMFRFPALKPWTLYDFTLIWFVISFEINASPIHLKSVKGIVMCWHEYCWRYSTKIKSEVMHKFLALKPWTLYDFTFIWLVISLKIYVSPTPLHR
jgi:hypothetical protein